MDPRIEELLPFYALDALSEEERVFVESYLAEHPELRDQVAEMQSVASALPQSITPVEPSRRTKEALMRRIARGESVRSSKQEQAPRRSENRWGNIFQALSLGVAVFAIGWVIVLNSQLAQLKEQVSTLGAALVAQSNSLEQINQSVEQINDKLPSGSPSDVVTISISGTDIQPRAHGQLIADPDSNSAVLVVAGLAQLEPGRTYQVWLIDGGGPKSAGLLRVDSNGQGLLIVTSEFTISDFNSLGISVEPDGGSEQPTGDIVVLSEL